MTRESLHWIPNTFYRLRDPRQTARIVSIESSRLFGEIFQTAKVRWVNDAPAVPAEDIENAGEWDLSGNSLRTPAYDLMERLLKR